MHKTQLEWINFPCYLEPGIIYLAEDHETNWSAFFSCNDFLSEYTRLIHMSEFPVIGFIKKVSPVFLVGEKVLLKDGTEIPREEIFEEFEPKKIFSEII